MGADLAPLRRWARAETAISRSKETEGSGEMDVPIGV